MTRSVTFLGTCGQTFYNMERDDIERRASTVAEEILHYGYIAKNNNVVFQNVVKHMWTVLESLLDYGEIDSAKHFMNRLELCEWDMRVVVSIINDRSYKHE